MAYDEQLADRVRGILSDEFGVTEQKMFGGLAFMLRGNMCCGVMGEDLILRVGPEGRASALEKTGIAEFDFTGRPMKAFVMAEASAIATDEDLRRWVDEAVAFAGSLPAK